MGKKRSFITVTVSTATLCIWAMQGAFQAAIGWITVKLIEKWYKRKKD